MQTILQAIKGNMQNNSISNLVCNWLQHLQIAQILGATQNLYTAQSLLFSGLDTNNSVIMWSQSQMKYTSTLHI